MQKAHKQHKLFEGLRPDDLKNMVSNRFTIDQYKSKMGIDADIIVVAFRVEDKFPAIDLMEFIEKGYPAVLDSDMSTGEEKDGKYAVFVEFDRDPKFPEQLSSLLKGVSQLCGCKDWRFKYFRDVNSYDFSIEKLQEVVPLTKDQYLARIKQQDLTDVGSVLDQGPAEIVDMDENKNITLRKTYSGDLKLHLDSIGNYDALSESLQGHIQLDESSIHQVAFLEKYLGNYQIHKIGNKF